MSRPGDLRKPAFASLALAFASFGDAFLYPFLPVNHGSAGIAAMWVGVLLSINRVVRIFSNGIVVNLFSRFGLRTVMITAASFAVFSTLGYAVASGIIAWIFFRIGWGLSFSALRIGTLGYALQSPTPGLSLGISRSLQELGPAVALFTAPVLLRSFDVDVIFIVLAIMSTPALAFAAGLPKRDDKIPPGTSKALVRFPSVFNAITLVSAMLIDGMVVVVLGVLFLQHGVHMTPLTATTLAAFYLGYRRVCLVLLSPAAGWLSDRVGVDKVFNASVVMMMAGLLLLVMGSTAVGAIVLFAFYSINAAITPATVVRGEPPSLAAVAENATWRDIGAAVGTLIGGILIASPFLTHTLIIAIFGLLILLLIHMGTAQRAFKFLYLWK